MCKQFPHWPKAVNAFATAPIGGFPLSVLLINNITNSYTDVHCEVPSFILYKACLGPCQRHLEVFHLQPVLHNPGGLPWVSVLSITVSVLSITVTQNITILQYYRVLKWLKSSDYITLAMCHRRVYTWPTDLFLLAID